MKILQVSNFLTPVHGGSAEVPFQVSKELAGRGHDVTIYTSDSRLEKSVIVPGVKIIAFRTIFSFAGYNLTPAMKKKAAREIPKFEVIHLHNLRTYQNIIAHRYAKKAGIPYVVQAHGSLATFFQKGWLKKIFDIIWGKAILKDAARVLALNEMEAAQCRSLGVREDKIEIVPNGIDLTELENLPPRGEFRKKYGLEEKLRVILFLGRLNRIKGLDMLLETFAGFRKKTNNVKLVMVGPDDGYLGTLTALARRLNIENDILFTGPIYGKDRLAAYVDCDVYVLPSSYDTFPVTVIEAMACRKPVIITERCGLAGAIGGRAGLVVPYDKTALEKAFIDIIDDESLKDNFGRQGRSLVEEKYNWSKIAVQLEDIYGKIASSTKKS